MPPFVTVIVPVRNEDRFLEATLRALLLQHYAPDRFEVIVVDGQSHDDTVAVVRRLPAQFANLHLLYNPRPLSSAPPNPRVRPARGQVVLVVDRPREPGNPPYPP